MILNFYALFYEIPVSKQNSPMGRRVLRRHIMGYTVCLCPTKGTPGLNELNQTVIISVVHVHIVKLKLINKFCFSFKYHHMNIAPEIVWNHILLSMYSE